MIRTVAKCRNFRHDCARHCSLRVLRITCLTVLLVAASTATVRGAAQQAPGDYATELGYVYAGYQEIVALKEACDEAVPRTRAANNRAFSEWQTRHKDLLAELKRRVTAMIRSASNDPREHARNLGKYEGAILTRREQYKMSFLALGPEKLGVQCERLSELLGSPAADLNAVFASELETIRKHK